MNKKASATSFFFSLIILAFIVLIEAEIITANFPLKEFTRPLTILFITVIVARIAKQMLHSYFDNASKKLRVFDKTRYALFGKLVSVVIWLIGIGIIVSSIDELRAASVSIFAGAGVLAVIIGFATQKTLGNISSGIFIATFQPYRIGDRLQLMGEYGKVTDINLRHTTIETWDNRRIIIPNNKMDEEIIDNYTIGDPAILGTLEMGISYDSNVDRAREIMQEQTLMHPDFFDYQKHKDMLSSDEKIVVRMIDMSDSAIVLKLYFWAYDYPTYIKMQADIREKVKKQFDKEGIEIPFPYRTLVYKKDLKDTHRTKKKSKK